MPVINVALILIAINSTRCYVSERWYFSAVLYILFDSRYPTNLSMGSFLYDIIVRSFVCTLAPPGGRGGDFVVFWSSDFQTVFHTAELSTNYPGDFVVFWNSDVQTVSIHSGAFNQFPRGFCDVLEL